MHIGRPVTARRAAVIGDPAYIERLLNIAEESQEPTPWMDRQRV
jgi:hypothetical protein